MNEKQIHPVELKAEVERLSGDCDGNRYAARCALEWALGHGGLPPSQMFAPNPCSKWLSQWPIGKACCVFNHGLLGYCECAKHYDPVSRATTGLAAPLTEDEQREAERRMRVLMPDLFGTK